MPLNNYIAEKFNGFNAVYIFFAILIIIAIILILIGAKNHFDEKSIVNDQNIVKE